MQAKAIPAGRAQVNNRVLALDPGQGAAGVVVFEFQTQPGLADNAKNFPRWEAIYACSIRPKLKNARRDLRKSQADAEQIAEIVRGVRVIAKDYGVRFCVAELPDAGAPRYSVCRAISLSTGWLVTFVECQDLTAEYYRPKEVKYAATGNPNASKAQMMSAMGKKYPVIAQIKFAADREHAADAAGAFEAALTGPMLKTIMGMVR